MDVSWIRNNASCTKNVVIKEVAYSSFISLNVDETFL